MDTPAQVQVIENRAEIVGAVRRVALHPSIEGQSLVSLDVTSVSDVEGYPNLFGWAKGLSIEVTLPTADVAAMKVAAGQTVTWVIKKTSPTSARLVKGSSNAMPVQPVENQADVAGAITAVASAPERPGYSVVTIAVDSVSPVGAYANLLAWASGKSLDVTVSTDLVTRETLAPGKKVSWRLTKKGPNTVFVVPRDVP